MKRHTPISWLILIFIGIGLSTGAWKYWQHRTESQQQAQLTFFREETDRQLNELDELLFHVRETPEHSQIWWRTMDFLEPAKKAEKQWKIKTEAKSRAGSFEEQMHQEAIKRVEKLSEFMKM